ncbi:SIR2 family NAD-dependent protein deacylase [Azotobacter beijerinckii]|nr:SIR2 family protein [Azotobacter beijerinckii]
MSIKINDEVHYNAIRKALANGNAAVMVGAGFSRNAENGDQLAMWYDVAKELWRELNPTDSDLKDFSAGMVTQLGEQYARVFSKPALEEVLKRLIPDDRVRPGILHNQLLQLPWSEIFTTNYDTLLERAADDIVERAHYTVICREDIPQSKILGRRRIVKLHGSFPSQRPFIFTEDDYRRYPELFAPFVNLVRQSLLENVFCLVGFSGDDPNFLHWIGWVRDMLDKHALPIYLFVSRAPSLGQRTLLEARQVTPVVLPLPSGVDELDYFSRFDAMFRLLAKPLEEEDSEWGDLPPLDQVSRLPHQDVDERRSRLLNVYAPVGNLRRTYPGWLIAPISVRRRFQHSIDAIPGFLNGKDLLDKLVQDTPHVGVAVLAEYAWHQEVLLQCFDDSLALAALALIKATSKYSVTMFDKQKTELKRFGIESTIEFQRRWRDLGVSLLRWARQELRRDDFNALKELLASVLPKDLQLHDEIAHESILLALYEGDRDIAHRLLSEWHIRSSDSYMRVRKGMLLGEVGKPEAGIAVSLKGLQQLRSNQRLRSNSTQYLSQEAWACLAISYLQTSKSWRWPSTEEDSNNALPSEQLDRRLADLAAKGFDSRLELQQLTAALNAETPPPSQPKSYTPQFELGRYSATEQLNGSQNLRDKIYAAFAWLTLSDRVALVPRIESVTFDIGSFAQAAWWVQYADSMQRVLSVMIRGLNKNMLKPRNPNQLLHTAGWLSRYQVARTEESLALQICSRSLSLVERMFSDPVDDEDLQRVTGFHMDVFARLVIRISDTAKVYSFMERVIALYHQPLLWRLHLLWKELALVLSRCFEALPVDDRARIAPSIASIPDVTALLVRDQYFEDDWICLHMLQRRDNDLIISNENHNISAVIDNLISKLEPLQLNQNPSNAPSTTVLKDAWQRLFWLNSWGFITNSQKEVIRQFLVKGESWPLIPGHYPWAAFTWLDDNNVDFDLSFRRWILSQEITSFAAPSSFTISSRNSRKSWSPLANNDLLQNWIRSLERKPWPESDMLAGLQLVKRWWDNEWQDVREELLHVNELRTAVNQRLDLFDSIVAAMVENENTSGSLCDSNIGKWFQSVVDQSAEFGNNFWRFRLMRALK